MVSLPNCDLSTVVSLVNEFYSTTDDKRRQELDELLCSFNTSFPCNSTLFVCFRLILPPNGPGVQYFGAKALYDIIRHRWEECLSDTVLTDQLKGFLIENLTNHSTTQSQSITNKLSSSLALFALYSLPDVWCEPVAELTTLWAGSPELLLRVLAEMAAELHNVQMPLTQRSVLKTELHRLSKDIIRIIWTILNDSSPSPSLLNAIVECVEQWLSLPGTSLEQWTQLLSILFSAVQNDSSGLTSLLSILSSNDELTQMEQLIMDICQYIATVIAQKVLSDLSSDSIDSEDTITLVSSICAFCVKAVPTLIRKGRKEESGKELLRSLCSFSVSLSSHPGVFAVDEAVSDLPSSFFTSLREDLSAMSTGSSGDTTPEVLSSIRHFYASLLQSAVHKLSFPSQSIYQQMDKEQREQFHNYRRDRSELSIDVYHIVGGESLQFLNQSLKEAIGKNEFTIVESCLYLWDCVADYLSETDYPSICDVVQICQDISISGEGREYDVLYRTLSKLLYSLSHLISEHETASSLELCVFHLILPNISRPRVVEEALRTLDKYAQDRPNSLLEIGEQVSETCYSYFANEGHPDKLRLNSLKIIGYVLSMQPAGTVMEVLTKILSPHISDLHLDNGNIDEKKRLFQISIFSCLFSSLQSKKAHPTTDGMTPVVLILLQSAPLLTTIVKEPNGGQIVDKVVEAVRYALCALDSPQLPQFLPFFCEIIDSTMVSNAPSACTLTKSLILSCGSSSHSLYEWLSSWVVRFDELYPNGNTEEWIGLVYQIMKKEWKSLRSSGEAGIRLITASISLAGKGLSTSEEPCVVKTSAQILATIVTNSTNFADEKPREILAANGADIIKVVFCRIQYELMRQTVEALAEVLFFFMKQYTTETKQCLLSLEHGDSPMVAALFREIGNMRNFKQMTLRLNMAARKDKKT